MKNLLRVLLLGLLVGHPVTAGAGSLTLLGVGSPGAGTITFSLTWVGAAGDSSATGNINYSVTGTNTTDANRYLIAFVCAREATVNTITSVTIDGVATTLVNAGSTTASNWGGTNGSNCGLYQQNTANSSCTSPCTVNVVYGANATRSAVNMYRLVTGTAAASNSGSYTNASSGGNTVSTTVSASGKGIIGFWESASAAAMTWGNATQDAQGNDPSNNSRYSVATINGTGSVSVTTAAVANGSNGSWASWGP
jgi:hypothetical protein